MFDHKQERKKENTAKERKNENTAKIKIYTTRMKQRKDQLITN